MAQRRKLVGGDDSYRVFQADELDANGNVVGSWFEVYGPDGSWLESFQTLTAALDFVQLKLAEQKNKRHPRERPR